MLKTRISNREVKLISEHIGRQTTQTVNPHKPGVHGAGGFQCHKLIQRNQMQNQTRC